jgi:serine/threonine protein kinase
MVDRVGQQLGNYRLVSLLGQGGFAEVYLGQHVRLTLQAAIKVLHTHLAGSEAEHFYQEAETIAKLTHPSIVRILDFDVQEGVPFLVMDYAQGGSLRQRYPKGSLVPLPVIVSVVKQVAEALQYAHEQKFIHRVVKPENMLVGKRQEILLSDFGIATMAHSTSSLSTSAEGTSGTLAYMAPEQIEGHPRAASDQYALAVVVYEWLCGERPFEGSVSELIAQQLSMPPPLLRERVPAIPSEVEQVVLRALAKDPKARFASVADFATALEQASQRALPQTAQLGSSRPAPSPVAASSYETVAVAPGQPGQPAQPTETTPSAELSVGDLEPTLYPGSSGTDDAGPTKGQASPEIECSTVDWIGGRNHRGRHPGQREPARALRGARPTQPFAPFLADLWVDGPFAPLPAHHFSTMAPAQILKSSENLNPKVVSGPFMMAQSVPGDHYTVIRNPHYYLAREGLPYLDQIVFAVYPTRLSLAGSVDNTTLIDAATKFLPQEQPHLKDYTRIYPPSQGDFEALYFNFHNQVLASHLEVRQAMALAVDQQTIIAGALKGLGTPLCTDHPSAYHPGYEPAPPCPVFGLAAANQELDDAGWVRGSDGVRTKDGQRLEFEYSTAVNNFNNNEDRATVQSIIQRDFGQIGIKLDIQNYSPQTFFGSVLPQGKASPPTGAVAGRYDIAEFANSWTYDPDDSGSFACNQFPPTGGNVSFYCNPALDKLFAQEQATADPGVRQQLFEQIHQIYLTQFPFIVLYSPVLFGLVHKGTHNYLPGPFTDSYNIAQWWCDGGKC